MKKLLDKLEAYCPSCEQRQTFEHLGTQEFGYAKLHLYNCSICGDTLSIEHLLKKVTRTEITQELILHHTLHEILEEMR